MVKGIYINKIADSVYRVELGDKSVDINVSDPQDQSTIDQELAEIKTGIETSETGVLVRPDVIWRAFNIAKVLRKYDYDAANCWCAHEWGSSLRKWKRLLIRSGNVQSWPAPSLKTRRRIRNGRPKTKTKINGQSCWKTVPMCTVFFFVSSEIPLSA